MKKSEISAMNRSLEYWTIENPRSFMKNAQKNSKKGLKKSGNTPSKTWMNSLSKEQRD